ncbi:transglutaminase domain-containing protein [Lacinutrix chionoecetis]
MKNLLPLFAFLLFTSAIAQISDFKTIDFTIADNVAKLNKGSDLKNLPVLAHKLTYKLPTKVEKFRAIYTWVCNNIEGDYFQNEKVSKKQRQFKNDSIAYVNWNNKYKKTAFSTLINQKKTMCTGYAYLIKELCFFANIECEIIDGYGRSATSNVEELEATNHSWNAVKLNNKWYLCDATWSSGYTTEENIFTNDYNDGYFLTDPDLFSKNHHPIDSKWLLKDTLKNVAYQAPPLVYGETFKHKVIPVTPEKMDFTVKRNEEINWVFKAIKDSTKKKVSLVEITGGNTHVLNIYNFKNENGNISFNYKFKRKGYYDVHLKIDEDIVATYTIEVLKVPVK